MLTKEKKSKVIDQFKKSKNDVGSCEVQIALLSEKIKHVAEHLKTFPKDQHSQRGLVKLVGKRKAFVNYLKKSNPKSCSKVSQLLETNN
jgi:small subunit ribosomal protein S15